MLFIAAIWLALSEPQQVCFAANEFFFLVGFQHRSIPFLMNLE
jgi:hypothetical protein